MSGNDKISAATKKAKALGSRGGKARKKALSPERRTEIAREAANRRWSKLLPDLGDDTCADQSWVHESTDQKITVERVASHRNGISGEPFHLILFRDKDGMAFIATVFDQPGHIAVLNRSLLSQGQIDFAINSWRGDEYELALRQAVADYRRVQEILPSECWFTGWSPAEHPLPEPAKLPEKDQAAARDRQAARDIAGITVADVIARYRGQKLH